MDVYVSDQQSAIDDFESLNATITPVGVVPADEVEDDASATEAVADDEADGVVERDVKAGRWRSRFSGTPRR